MRRKGDEGEKREIIYLGLIRDLPHAIGVIDVLALFNLLEDPLRRPRTRYIWDTMGRLERVHEGERGRGREGERGRGGEGERGRGGEGERGRGGEGERGRYTLLVTHRVPKNRSCKCY